MLTYVMTREICEELGIDDYLLSQYIDFLELPRPNNDHYDLNMAKLIARLHELVGTGLSLNDIRQLSSCAEQYAHIVPQLKNFRDFSPHHHLKELVAYYNEMLSELSFRETQYQEKIHNLESVIQKMQSELERNGIAHDQVETYQYEKERYRLELQAREEELESLAVINSQLQARIGEAEYQNNQQKDELEKLKAELEYFSSGDTVMKKRSAIDIQALLRKKEKEVELKHQREIFDLKKQVDMLLEKREQEWSTRV